MNTKKENTRRLIQYLMTHPCSKCGENNICCLDFHHINPDEKFKAISTLINEGYEWNIIEQEISKTKIMCTNCHRKLTAFDNKWQKCIEEYFYEENSFDEYCGKTLDEIIEN